MRRRNSGRKIYEKEKQWQEDMLEGDTVTGRYVKRISGD